MANTETIPGDLLKVVKRPETDEKGRVVTEKKRGEEVPKLRAIEADEVFAWKEYSDRVVVVTTDGQKFVGAKTAK